MGSKYIGFDKPPVGQNGFELFKDGKPLLSLYHDCKLLAFLLKDQKLSVELEKVHNSGHGPTVGSKARLTFLNADIISVEASGFDNSEDLNEFTILEEDENRLKLRISLGSSDYTIYADSIELKMID